MREKVKKIILDTIESVKESNKWLKQITSINEMNECGDTFRNVLVDQQEAIIMIGEELEKESNCFEDLVHKLEEYCEELWQLSENVGSGCEKTMLIELEKKISNIEAEIRMIEGTYDVVFMPYKASMWDSMESVWLAAKEDPRCECYVVPLAYCERNEKGGVGKIHYEIELFPKYVPTVSFRNYDIRKRFPDVIYIHNPYDGGNFVTSVDREYYSSELKKYTDCLVYIPYYFRGWGPYSEAHQRFASYNNIDKIIVQGRDKLDGICNYVENDKLLPLGSPKADRVLELNTRRDKLLSEVIPEEWRNKIKDKKIFLYNVSISGILQNSSVSIKKMRYIFDYFKARQDVILIWRPHPLLEATYQTMRPELYQEYQELKSEFKKSGNAIYDDTADVGIVTAIADAYVGENTSSMVHYFGIAGKPKFFISWNWSTNTKSMNRSSVIPANIILENNKIIFTPQRKDVENIIYEFEISNGKVKKYAENIWDIQKEPSWGSYRVSAKCGNKIIYAAYNAKNSCIYDVESHSTKMLSFKDECGTQAFNQILQFNNKVYLKPRMYPALIEIDMDNYAVVEYKECIDELLGLNRNANVFPGLAVVRGNSMYIPASNASKIAIFDMCSGEYTIKNIGEYKWGYQKILYDGESFWLIPWERGSIVRWNEDNGCDCFHYDCERQPRELAFELKDNCIVIFTNELDMVIEINICNGSVERRYCLEKNIVERKNNISDEYFYVNRMGDKWIYFRYCDYSFVIWDLKTNEIELYPCNLPNKQVEKDLKNKIDSNGRFDKIPYAVIEGKTDMDSFVDYVKADLYDYKEKEMMEYNECFAGNIGCAGVEIHKEIIKSIIK